MKDFTHICEIEQLENPPKLAAAAHIQHSDSLFWIVYSSVAQAWPLMVHTQCLSGIIQIVYNHKSYSGAHISPLVCHFSSWCDPRPAPSKWRVTRFSTDGLRH